MTNCQYLKNRRQNMVNLYQLKYVSKNGCEWNSNPCSIARATRNILGNQSCSNPFNAGQLYTIQSSQLCVDTSSLAYKNANHFETAIASFLIKLTSLKR